jgi:F-type H+-transporting ATPase subunit a
LIVLGLIAAFEKPTTKDFIWGCFSNFKIAGVDFCVNFIFLLIALAFLAYIAFFVMAFRKPTVVPNKRQALGELAMEFVREQVVLQMIGPDGMRFFPLLASFFFFIFFMNILEVVPGLNLSPSSRIAFPIVLALISWVTYNAVGISRHGFFGYLKMVLFPPGAPKALYILLSPIEFFTTIIVRPITLSVRLFANLVAGHFLLAVFFLGTIALFESTNVLLKPIGLFSGAFAIVMVGFEIFVAGLQAFIFAVLSASYIGGAMAEEH